MKYSYRGFEVAVPGIHGMNITWQIGFQRAKVDPTIYAPSFKASGLSLLLKFEKLSKDSAYWQIYDPKEIRDHLDWKQAMTEKRQKLNSLFRVTFTTVAPKLVETKVETDSTLEVESDYESAFLPW